MSDVTALEWLGPMTAMVALLDQPAAVLDLDGTILTCNGAFTHGLAPAGCDPEHHPIGLVLSPTGQKQFSTWRSKSPREGAECAVETQIVHQGVSVHLTLKVLAPAGSPVGFLCQQQKGSIEDELRLRFFLERHDHGVWDYDIANDVFLASDTWRKMHGIGPDDPLHNPDVDWMEEVHEDDREELAAMLNGQLSGKSDHINIAYRRRHQDGHWFWILCRASIMDSDADGKPLRLVGTDTDITDIKAKDAEMFQLATKLQLAVEASGMGIWEFDPDNGVIHWDDRMLEIYGMQDGENDRSSFDWEDHLHPDDLEDTLAYSDECQRLGQDFNRDYRVVRQDGEVRHIRSMARSVRTLGDGYKLIGINLDITEHHRRTEELEEARQKLEYESLHDALTGLANRRLLDQTVAELFENVDAFDTYAVLHLDLDNFKTINDTLGHAAGDAVLCHVAGLLRQILPSDVLICRSGGDEFVILITSEFRTEALHKLARSIVKACEVPFLFEGHACAFGVSIGLAIGQGVPDKAADIFIQADKALYAAKHAGRSRYEVYSEGLNAPQIQRQQDRQDLLDAIANRELTCFFQPQYAPRSLMMTGAEVLVRWQCPRRGILTPDKFMPLAEETGLMPQIDAATMQKVLALQDKWAAEGLQVPKVSLNLSQQRLSQSTLAHEVRSLLRPHHHVTFELLETAFLDEANGVMFANIAALKSMNVQIELDDFGAGHSSVVAMQLIQPARVKIDQRLVFPVAEQPQQVLTLQALARIAALEGIGVVIEGVESKAHLAAIQNISCDALQGYILARPMSPTAFEQLLSGTKLNRLGGTGQS